MKLKIVATGDMFPGNMGYHSKIGIAWDFYKHKGKMWEDLFEEILMPSDICIVNLEAPLVHDDDFPNNDYFAGAVDFAAFMKRVGVTHANIANNHTLEQGKDGFLNTIKVLKKAGIEPIGCMDGSLPQVNYTEINGIMVGIVGFNQIHDIDPQGLYACYSEELVVQTLNRMEGVDLKIVVLHWGSEYVNIPSYEQTVSAKKFIDAGASIIIGHHPHVLQPVVMWNETVVAFSLGNILFDMWHSKNVRTGGILSIDYSKGQPLTYSVQGVFNYRQNQIKHIENEKFMRIMERHEKLFSMWQKMPPNKYIRKYPSYVKQKRLWNRILMKVDLLKNCASLEAKDRNKFVQAIMRRS